MLITLEQAAEARRLAYAEQAARAADSGEERAFAALFPMMVRGQAPDRGRAPIYGGVTLRAKLATHPTKGVDMINLHGFASIYDTRYEMWDFFGPYDEQVASTAGEKTLAADPDVNFLVNHTGLAMARTTNETLFLQDGTREEDGALGLESDAWLNPKRNDVKDLTAAVDDQTVDQMSFAFMLENGRWNEEFTLFTITEFDINRGDVSAVNYGANPYTSIAARTPTILQDIRRLPGAAARAAFEGLAAREDVTPKGLAVYFTAPSVTDLRERVQADVMAARGVTAADVDKVLAPAGTTPGRTARSITDLEALLNQD